MAKASSKSSLAADIASGWTVTSTGMRCAALWMRWCADDPGTDRGAGVAGNGPHRHEERVREPVAAGPGGVAARSAEWSSVLLSGPPRQPAESDLARRARRMPVHEAAGTRPISMAEPGRRSGDDLVCATRLSVVRH